MSIVRINAIAVPDGDGDEFEARFADRAREVERVTGFEGFELLRPVDGETWYVYTRWASRDDFDAWVGSDSFRRGHAAEGRKPLGHDASLLAFDIVLEVGTPLAGEVAS